METLLKVNSGLKMIQHSGCVYVLKTKEIHSASTK